MEGMLVIKLVVTITVVVVLSLLAEHASPRLSGLLAGFPHGVAIILLFVGLEQGEAFVAAAARYTLGGLAANMALAWTWAAVLRRLGHDGRASAREMLDAGGMTDARRTGTSRTMALYAPIAGLIVFFVVATIMRALAPGPWLATAIALIVITAAARWMRREADMRITSPIRPGPRLVLLRALLAALVVLAITGAARLLGPAWSGLMAGFPVVTFPFLLIVQATYGAAATRAVLKAYPQGLPALVAFALTVTLALPALGLIPALLTGFLAALSWSAVRQLAIRSSAMGGG